MNSHTQPKSKTSLFILALLACVPLSPKVLATDLGSVLPGNNTADGSGVLINRTTGINNSGFGFEALKADTSGSYNTATGIRALWSVTNNSYNTADGAFALAHNTGSNNTAIGYQALYSNTRGSYNTAIGPQALLSNTGNDNAAIGNHALRANTTGHDNIAIGNGALYGSTSGSFNIAIGGAAGGSQTTGSGNIYIGEGMAGAPGDNGACYIASIYGALIDPMTATTVQVDSSGKLGTATSLSSRRFKRDIKQMDNASEAVLALKPVTFHYKHDAKNTLCFGLVAEDVAGVNPGLVIPDKEGKPYAVRYEAVNAMLLNEFLKEHHTVQELKKEIAQLTATVKEQAAQIQKVSACIELNKPVAQTLAANQ